MDPATLDLTALGGIVRDLGTIGLLAIAIVAGLRGWVHTDREFQDERADKLEWKALALEAMATLSKATDVAERVAK